MRIIGHQFYGCRERSIEIQKEPASLSALSKGKGMMVDSLNNAGSFEPEIARFEGVEECAVRRQQQCLVGVLKLV